MKNSILLIIAILVISCSNEETEFKVDAKLEPFVTKFSTEASAHGKTFKKENLIIRVGIIQSLTKFDTNEKTGQREFIMDNSLYNDNINDNPLKIEGYVYMLLAGTFLNREQLSYDSEEFTIMNSNVVRTGYTEAQRPALIEELFK